MVFRSGVVEIGGPRVIVGFGVAGVTMIDPAVTSSVFDRCSDRLVRGLFNLDTDWGRLLQWLLYRLLLFGRDWQRLGNLRRLGLDRRLLRLRNSRDL
jgi:hypothetical protein